MPMPLIIVPDQAALAAAAATSILALLRQKPDAVLGLATGKTLEPVFAALVASGVSFARARIVHLDEMLGLEADDQRWFGCDLRRQFLEPLGIPAAHVRMLDGRAPDPEAECAAHEAHIIALGGLDLQVLGIGRNAHIGINEPGSAFDSRTRVVAFAEITRSGMVAQFADRPVPTHGMTLGIGTILAARQILLLANGANKAEAVRAAVAGPVGPACPATALRAHANVQVIVDRAAA